MTKRLFCADVEADNLLDDATKIWCASYTELSKKMEATESSTLTEMHEIKELFENPNNILVMHNGVSYDGPVVEKILGAKVEAEIVDTLYLSWYLYPRISKHGLAWWGEELGIAKPEIDDWESLSLKDYIHRCQEDVKIQVALWKQIWKHLMLLYNDPNECWHAIRHLNFKAKQAALAEKSKWKLDVDKCEEMSVFFDKRFTEAKDALEERMPDVPEYSKRKRPKKPYKVDGSLSKGGQNWVDIVEEYVDGEEYDNPIDYDGEVKVVKKMKAPNAGSSLQLKGWLGSLGWVPETFEFKRNKETNEVRKIPQVKNKDTGELCESIEKLIPIEPALEHLREMSIVKHRLGITNGFLKNVDSRGYVIAAVQGLTNTLRFKHKICVNLPSLRKPYGAEIRGLLIARSSKSELCGSDMSSLEDRTKQHYMWKYDPEYVTEMQRPDFDPHMDMAMAANMITQEQVSWYKSFNREGASDEDSKKYKALSLIRHAGKGTNYAATYGATGPTIARSAGVSESVGDVLHAAYWDRNWSLTAIADACIVKNSRGHKWLWNPVAKLWLYLKAEKDRFSTLNQSTGTYAFDRWVYYILERRNQLTGQFHDEVILELKSGNRDAMTKILKESVADVNKELNLDRDLDCDVDFGRSYAEIH